MIDVVLFTMLHLLVFAYWLGGDLGVFYASTLLTDDQRDRAGRLAAGKILNDVDLAPRFCLLLALPTGLLLADARGWLSIGNVWLGLIVIAALAWIWLVWTLHKRHDAAQLRRLDTALRFAFLAALLGAALAGMMGVLEAPLFLELKLLTLAFAISMGLLVRRALAPFGAAYGALAAGDASEEVNRTIAQCLSRARPAVIAIWIALIIAALLGVVTPT